MQENTEYQHFNNLYSAYMHRLEHMHLELQDAMRNNAVSHSYFQKRSKNIFEIRNRLQRLIHTANSRREVFIDETKSVYVIKVDTLDEAKGVVDLKTERLALLQDLNKNLKRVFKWFSIAYAAKTSMVWRFLTLINIKNMSLKIEKSHANLAYEKHFIDSEIKDLLFKNGLHNKILTPTSISQIMRMIEHTEHISQRIFYKKSLIQSLHSKYFSMMKWLKSYKESRMVRLPSHRAPTPSDFQRVELALKRDPRVASNRLEKMIESADSLLDSLKKTASHQRTKA